MVGAVLLMLAAGAAAQSVVNVCTTDNASGGVNLRDAVAAGGAVTFDCGAAPTQLRITAPLTVTRPLLIDGESRVTLHGPVAGPLFDASAALELANLEVSNDTASAGGIVRGPQSDVTLRNVRTVHTPSAYRAASVTAQDSVFETNGLAGSVGVVIDAERIHLLRASFSGNLDHPVGGGMVVASHAPLGRSILIEDSTFADNAASVLAHDAVLTVRGGRFLRNGSTSTGVPIGWTCCGGAITAVHSRVAVFDAEFVDNAASGLGGAIHAVASEVRLVRSLFAGNKALVGGAVFSWAQPMTGNFWSTQAGAAPAPGLSLSSARFRGNNARFGGGAIAWAGSVSGDSALFNQNTADVGAAVAHWSAVELPVDQPAFGGLIELTTDVAQVLSLARVVFVENEARAEGSAIAGGVADVSLGNALVVRNALTDPSSDQGAAIAAEGLQLTNASVVDNASGGVKLLPSGRGAALLNTLILQNQGYGCSINAAKLGVKHASLQFPGNDCAGIEVGAPKLDAHYRPSLGDLASDRGDLSACMSAPLVAAVDLGGNSRGNKGTCAIGAYEPDPRIDATFGWSMDDHSWVRMLLYGLLLLLFLLGFFLAWMLVRRRRRRTKTVRSHARRP